MARKRPPWMRESDEIDKARIAADKLAKKARGSRVFAVLPWREDARYDGVDVIRWFRARPTAEKFADGLNDNQGRGLVVREWTWIHNPDVEPAQKTSAQLEREIEDVMSRRGSPWIRHEDRSRSRLP